MGKSVRVGLLCFSFSFSSPSLVDAPSSCPPPLSLSSPLPLVSPLVVLREDGGRELNCVTVLLLVEPAVQYVFVPLGLR